MPRKTKKAEAVVAEELSAESAVAPADATFAAPDLEPEPEDADESSVLFQAVTFRLEGQIYGLPLEAVQEIQQLVEYTPLPDSAPALVGLIDLRGLVVPAIDLRVLLGLMPRDFTLETPMVFCRVRGHVVCLIVDSVEDVVDLPSEGLQPPSNLSSMADRMLGMCRLPQGLVLLLDIDRLVPDAALAAADAVEGGHS